MWSNTGEIPDPARDSLNCSTSPGERSLYPHPRGLRENIWNVSQPMAAARSTASEIDAAMETWTPTLTMRAQLLPQLPCDIPSDRDPRGKKGLVREGGRGQNWQDGIISRPRRG